MKNTLICLAFVSFSFIMVIFAGCGADVRINTPNLKIEINASSLPDATSGTAYNQTLAAAGGTAPYTWSLSAGTLPTGLSLTSTTGVISGTPAAAGTSTFTVTVTDSATNTASKQLSILVNPAGSPLSLSITNPTVANGMAIFDGTCCNRHNLEISRKSGGYDLCGNSPPS